MAWVGARGNPLPGAVQTGAERFPGNIDVLFGPTPSGPRAFRLEVYLGREVPVSEARAEAGMLHPPDGRPVGTYIQAGQTIEVFQSARLAQAFEGAELPLRLGPYFGDEPPGTYIEIAERGRPTTSVVLLAVGNNP